MLSLASVRESDEPIDADPRDAVPLANQEEHSMQTISSVATMQAPLVALPGLALYANKRGRVVERVDKRTPVGGLQ